MSSITVEYYGRLVPVTGIGRETVSESGIRNISELLEYIENKYESSGEFEGVAVALNDSLTSPSAALGDGDIVALLPPVSGG